MTGGIACGKSLIGRLFKERQVPVVDDDVAARDAVAPGSEGLADVVAEFGEGILAPDGSLDRPALGKIVFADDGLRRKLMAITHPRIGALIAERFRAAEESGAPFVVYESALLIENGNVDAWRPLVVVCTNRETQIERMASRNGLSREDAEDRIRSQMAVEEKVAQADYIIDNSSTTQHAADEFERVYAALVARAPAA